MFRLTLKILQWAGLYKPHTSNKSTQPKIVISDSVLSDEIVSFLWSLEQHERSLRHKTNK